MKIRYAALKPNDVVDGYGICVSLWTQGCPFRCKGCHNPETWDYDGGIEIDKDELIDNIIKLINMNGVERNFSILGGEPLCLANRNYVKDVILKVREAYKDIKIFLWTGFKLRDLVDMEDESIKTIIENVNTLIDGQFELEHRDITLPLRGSPNQHIINLH